MKVLVVLPALSVANNGENVLALLQRYMIGHELPVIHKSHNPIDRAAGFMPCDIADRSVDRYLRAYEQCSFCGRKDVEGDERMWAREKPQ